MAKHKPKKRAFVDKWGLLHMRLFDWNTSYYTVVANIPINCGPVTDFYPFPDPATLTEQPTGGAPHQLWTLNSAVPIPTPNSWQFTLSYDPFGWVHPTWVVQGLHFHDPNPLAATYEISYWKALDHRFYLGAYQACDGSGTLVMCTDNSDLTIAAVPL